MLVLTIAAMAVACMAARRTCGSIASRNRGRIIRRYDARKAIVTGTTPTAGTVTGTVQELRDVTRSREPPATGARVGVRFRSSAHATASAPCCARYRRFRVRRRQSEYGPPATTIGSADLHG